jgi:N-acylneuraminate cytidylyltransferase
MDNLVKKRIAIIPARGGSKRIPKKNILDFFGKPMIAWTIESALNTKMFDTVLVSTDDEEIAEISISYGAQVPFLRNQNTDDFSTVSEATLTALDQLNGYNGKTYETVVQLMANCPLRSTKNIIDQLEVFHLSKEKINVLSGFQYGMFNPWWAHQKDQTKKYKRVFKDSSMLKRSQDLPELICPSGATWISSVENLKKNNSFYSEEYTFHKLTWQEAVDIDDESDLLLAKAAYMISNEKV